MPGLNSDLFLMLYYAAGVVVFAVALVPLLLVGFFTFSMLPSMLFSRFYDRMYKRLGFLPETMLFLLCSGVAAALTANVMTSPPLCADPLATRQPAPLLSFYQVRPEGPAILIAGPRGPTLGQLPPGTTVYALPPAPTSPAALVKVTRAQLPGQPRAVAVSGLVAPAQLAPARFLAHPFAFLARDCQPAFAVAPRTLLQWPW
jgi:hypothetical protein